MEKRTTSPRTKPSPCMAVQRIWRAIKTLFFLGAMMGSLLFFSAPLLVAVLDMLLPSAVLSALVGPVSPFAIAGQLRNYDFRASLVDLPLLSIVRSLIIICVYCSFQGPGLSRWPYLAITSVCSLSTASFVLVKACMAVKLGRQPTSYEALFVSSWVLAIAHMAVAYRTSCREKRKLLVFRIDLEAVSAYKGQFPGHSKLAN
ncbi:uncharacterized protein LOC144712247 [Wolffia australiana]